MSEDAKKAINSYNLAVKTRMQQPAPVPDPLLHGDNVPNVSADY